MASHRNCVFGFVLFYFAVLFFVSGLRAQSPASADSPLPIPVILDTDIGDDDDDCWALVFALKNPRLDIRLITTTYGERAYRGALVAKYLTIAHRTDIPIGLGAGPDETGTKMESWLAGFSLADYHGKVFTNGVLALINTIRTSPQPITLIINGPLHTVGAALRKDPGIAPLTNLAGMQGSIRVGYDGRGQTGEYNVHRDISDAQAVFSAPWRSVALAPLDTASLPRLNGPRYQALLNHGDPLVQALLLNHALTYGQKKSREIDHSGTNWDEVGVFLAEPEASRLINFEKLPIRVDDRGWTLIDPAGREMNLATSWKNLDGFLDHLKEVLLLKTTPPSPQF